MMVVNGFVACMRKRQLRSYRKHQAILITIASFTHSAQTMHYFAFEQMHKVAPHCSIHTFDPTSQPPSPGSIASNFVNFHGEYDLSGKAEGPTTT
jgi:hypothetical protein